MKSPDSHFFLSPILVGENILSEEESLHAIRVCRATIGDILEVADGLGHLAKAKITEANIKACKVFIENIQTFEKETPKIKLALACLKDDAIEEIVLHVAETLVDEIILLRTDYSQERKDSDLSKVIRRANLKARVSLKQSLKAFETKISGPVPLKDYLKNVHGTLVLCDINGKEEFPKNLKNQECITLFIGPEGGFSPSEIDLIQKQENVFSLKLGNTRLRAKTAALFAVGKLL